ncbi:MAG TPA: PilZ domain-containing protein [Myxococcales bacterium]|jgi:hypothetical protein
MEKRREKRIRKRLLVRFGEDELTQRGVTRDISASGAFVLCGQLPAIGARLKMEIQLGADNRVRAIGIVRRARQVPVELRQQEQMGFGIAFLGGRLVDLEARSAPPAQRQTPSRFEVHFGTGDALLDVWQRELRLGALMVASTSPVRFDERVRVQVCLDFAHQAVELPARVVRVLDGPPRTVAMVFEDLQAVRRALACYVAS